jgi:hypothetical protein
LRCGARPPYDPTGFEHQLEKPEKRGVGFEGGAKSGASDSDLQELIDIWRRLSAADRSAVLAKVRAVVRPKARSDKRRL